MPQTDTSHARPDVTVCLIAKNEKPYLVEWLAWYRMLGFDRIVIYDNNSTDGSGALLEALAAAGKVDYRTWELGRTESPMLTAYYDALGQLDTEWVLFADIDEFLILHNHERVTEFLATFADPGIAYVGVNWRLFGDGFNSGWEPLPVVRRFIMASQPDFAANGHFKSFTRTASIRRILNRHVCDVDGRSVHASGEPLVRKGYGLSERIDHSVAQINHYYGKTFEEYRKKMARGQAGVGEIDAIHKYNYTEAIFNRHNTNDVEDLGALRRLKALEHEMAGLMALLPADMAASLAPAVRVMPSADAFGAPPPLLEDVFGDDASSVNLWQNTLGVPMPSAALIDGGDEVDDPKPPAEAAPDSAAPAPRGLSRGTPEQKAVALGLFDAQYYRAEIDDADTPDSQLFDHYLTEGFRTGANPSERFSTAHYLRDYPGVAAQNLNPLRHYLASLDNGDRRLFRDVRGNIHIEFERLDLGLVADYFDADYYGLQADENFASEEAAMRHYFDRGWLEGYEPSPEFSGRLYLDTYRDVGDARMNPLAHFVLAGAREGRLAFGLNNPPPVAAAPMEQPEPLSPPDIADPVREAFDPAHYRSQYDGPPASDDELYLHYMTIGWREGYDPSPDFSTDYYLQVNVDIASSGMNPFEHYVVAGRAEGRSARDTVDTRDDTDYQIAIFAAWASGQRHWQPVDTMDDPAEALLQSGLADMAVLGTLDPDPRAAAAACLALEPGKRPVMGLFDPAFHADLYGLDDDDDALLHALAIGAQDPRYGSRAILERDIAIIDGLGHFDTWGYQAQLRREGLSDRGLGLVEHYLVHGAERDLWPEPGFDTAFYRRISRLTSPVRANPYVHYLLCKRRDNAFANRDALISRRAELAVVEDFDTAVYIDQENLPLDTDARTHYALAGNLSRARLTRDFDSSVYLGTYPDIGRSGYNGLLHFVRAGREEGRMGTASAEPERIQAGGQFPPNGARSVLVLSHEASRTGAPIVALNLARALGDSYKVVTWTGKPGPLSADFRAAATDHIASYVSGTIGDDLLSRLGAEHDFAFAIVNSIVSHPMLTLLNRHNIPTLSLIHEFASYVYPAGTVAAAALRSGGVVFPATVVESDFRDEMHDLQVPQGVPNVRIIPQGSNPPLSSGFGADDLARLKRRLGLAADGSSRVVFGAGSVNVRKGVDIFLQTCAALARDATRDWRFVWVGGGYDPLRDMGYSVYLREQIRKSGLEGRFFFIGEQPDLDLYWEIADVFLLSSRLDPFPNVVIDAIVQHVPVVCFEGATGASDVMPDLPFAVFTAPYLDAAAAAGACRRVVEREDEIAAAFAANTSRIVDYFSFARYVDRLRGMAPQAADKAAVKSAMHRALARGDDPAGLDLFNMIDVAHFIASGDPADIVDFGLDCLLCDDYRRYFTRRDGDRPLLSSLAFAVPVTEGGAKGEGAPLSWSQMIWGAAPARVAFERTRFLLPSGDLALVTCAGPGDGLVDNVFDGDDLVRAMQAFLAVAEGEWLLNVAECLAAPVNDFSLSSQRRLAFPVAASMAEAAKCAGDDSLAAMLMPVRLYPPTAAEAARLAAAGFAAGNLSLCGLSGLLRANALGACLAGFGDDWLPFIARPWREQLREIELRFYTWCARERRGIIRHPHF